MRYVFADCVLDTDQYALHRAGQPSKIRPKAFEVLTYLLRHRDRVVTKQELAEQSWPDQFITNAVVENTVKAVRRAVGDSGRTQQIIQTLRGYGYRFVAPVAEHVDAQTRPQDPSQMPAAGSAVAPSLLPVERPSTSGPSQTDGQLLTPSEVTTPAYDTPTAERRQLTVLFCDLVASTPLAGQLDLGT